VVQGKETTSFRLWLYDLSTGQVAYQDDYCQSCSLTDAMLVQANALVENPRFGAIPGPKPTYCNHPAADTMSAPAISPTGPIFLLVHGVGPHKPALHTAMKAQLEALGRTPLPVTVESKTYTLDILQKIVEGQQNARVLGAELKAGGRVELFLFDQKTGLTDDESVRCQDCSAENLVIQVKQAVAKLLDHCFGAQCAGTTAAAPPVEACEPFPDQQCPGLDALLSPSFSGGTIDRDHLTPKTVRLIKGLTWGAFAASAAATIALFAANQAVSADIGGRPYGAVLTGPAWTSAALTVLSLGVAIPITVKIKSASVAAPASGPAESPHPIQCPG